MVRLANIGLCSLQMNFLVLKLKAETYEVSKLLSPLISIKMSKSPVLFNTTSGGFLLGCCRLYNYQQTCSLVNVKLKWAKDPVLDTVVYCEKDTKAVNILISLISSAPQSCLPIYHLTRHRGQLDLPFDLKLATFIRRYPNIFDEFHALDSGGTRVPWFNLTPEALQLRQEELNLLEKNHVDILNRFSKLLMLTRKKTLPLQTIDQLKWDLGLPYNYKESMILKIPELFHVVQFDDGREGVKLLSWDHDLAVSELQKKAALEQNDEDTKHGALSFPIGFPRGFGLKRKCMEWLKEWQKLPYTSPYCEASHLDPRTDESEKRIVGVFHELLHLTLKKKTERKNVSNLRGPLALPQKFTKVFERHPGIFYISRKSNTQTVILREAYDRHNLVQKHPLVEFRNKLTNLMKEGFLDRSKGIYRTTSTGTDSTLEPLEIACDIESNGNQNAFGEESDSCVLSDYDSD